MLWFFFLFRQGQGRFIGNKLFTVDAHKNDACLAAYRRITILRPTASWWACSPATCRWPTPTARGWKMTMASSRPSASGRDCGPLPNGTKNTIWNKLSFLILSFPLRFILSVIGIVSYYTSSSPNNFLRFPHICCTIIFEQIRGRGTTW